MDNKKTENLLDFIGYHEKWHGQVQTHRKKYQYNQNDFLIEEIFKRMEITNGFFVEFGAWDGIFASNTRKLFESGWNSGILIEPAKDRFLDLQKNYLDYPNIHTVNSFVELEGNNTFDSIADNYVSDKIDFCSIDIDGLDLDIFETIEKYLPSVICIEGGQMLSPVNNTRLSREISKHNIQQGIYTMNQSFEKKGYKLLCTFQDSFFIKKEYYHLFNVEDDLFNLYLDGIVAYPRIPWIISTLNSVGLENDILNYIVKDIPLPISTSKEEKIEWINKNYVSICKAIEELRISYNKENSL
jgi:hypothetical protein